MNREIKTTLALDGDKAFKDAMSDAAREMRVLNSEMKASTAAFAGQENSTEALTAKSKILNAQVDQQKAIVAALAKAVQDSADKYGAADKKTDGYRIQLNNAQAALSKMENELGQTSSSLNSFGTEMKQEETKAEGLHSALSKVGTGLKSFAGAAGQAAVAGIKAIGLATMAAAAGAVAMGKQAIETADETQRLADVTGHTAEQIQIMQYQGKALGVDIETMTGAQAKLTKSMAGATDTTKGTGAAFKALGIEVRDKLTGQLRDSKTVMSEALDALGGVGNETERDALAMQIFGKSAMEMNPLIKAGGKALDELAASAQASGAIMSNEAVAGLDAFGDNMDALKMSMTGIAGTALSAMMPALQGATTQLQGLASAAAGALKSGDWSGFANQAGKLATDMIGKITQMLPAFIKVGTQILTSLIDALVTAIPVVLPQLIAGILQLFNAIVKMFGTQGPTLIRTAMDAIGALILGLLKALPLIMKAAIQIVLALVEGITKQLPVLIPAAVNAIMTMTQALIDNLPMIIEAAIQLILALVQGLINAMPQLLESAPKLIKGLIDGLIKALPMLIDAAIQLITMLVGYILDNLPMMVTAALEIMGALIVGILQAIPQLMQTVPKLFKALGDKFKEIDWGSIGKSIIDGIVEGIKRVASNIADAAKNAATGALNAVKSLLGIKSPSTVMRDQVGLQMGAGMAEGITGSAGTVKAAMGKLSSNMVATARTSLALDVTGSARSGVVNGSGGINITINGNINSRSDALAMAERITSRLAERSRGRGLATA